MTPHRVDHGPRYGVGAVSGPQPHGQPEWVVAAVGELTAAYQTGVGCPPLRGRLLPAGEMAAAYAVQQAQLVQWTAAGRRPVGAKIGLTSRVVQAQLGVDQPDFGVLLADMAVPDGEQLGWQGLLAPRVEAEVAFVLGADLTVPDPTVAEVIGAVDYLLPAIEIVDSRVAGWDISIVDTVADNASSGRFVLGTAPRPVSAVDLRGCGMVLERNGRPVSTGAGAACLGNPLHAVAWLAGVRAAAGAPLRAGDLVLSGALGPMVPVSGGEAFEARISGLGSVRVCFELREGAV
ncbi:fumarylacetoacetate hydrolase family protein [Natronosporangium hydrolyticum]|uniref:Fumarylacetoacetate hydrolase family protein n=1 Tax=Natronosporangium hydrolyticum TaxID=2811111 RepID=A0A895YKG0_9ACTN|nr:fumarylacetoacetate hydrolase family protein [Natronosporangium hydrolyticum]QSB15989.1 fumarylacetoacetate hydrolase family protein [Natronosporangium hydrolyticum]